MCRGRSMFVATRRYSGSRMANPNPFSSSARTLAVSPGLSSTADNTARVSLRYAKIHKASQSHACYTTPAETHGQTGGHAAFKCLGDQLQKPNDVNCLAKTPPDPPSSPGRSFPQGAYADCHCRKLPRRGLAVPSRSSVPLLAQLSIR